MIFRLLNNVLYNCKNFGKLLKLFFVLIFGDSEDSIVYFNIDSDLNDDFVKKIF